MTTYKGYSIEISKAKGKYNWNVAIFENGKVIVDQKVRSAQDVGALSQAMDWIDQNGK